MEQPKQIKDALYESLVRQVATTLILSSEKDLHQAVAKTQEIEDIKRSLFGILCNENCH